LAALLKAEKLEVEKLGIILFLAALLKAEKLEVEKLEVQVCYNGSSYKANELVN
jgi:hypothetical protein